MQTLSRHIASVARVCGSVAVVLVVALALDSTANEAKPGVKGEPYTSGCTHILTVPSVVYPGDWVTVTAKGYQGGVCGASWVWMSYAVEAELDGEPGSSGGANYIYDYCYDGSPQPIVPGGVGVNLPDSNTHTIRFRISDDRVYSDRVVTNNNGRPCSSNSGNTKNICGPAVVMSGNGGTVGWSTVRFFELASDDPGSTIDDYDGDGKADPSMYEQDTGTWKVRLSVASYQEFVVNALLGGPGWKPATADYDGDKIADPAVYQDAYTNGNWSILSSACQYAQKDFPALLGGYGYVPVKGDFDGDGLDDPTVYNESSGVWKSLLSTYWYAPRTLSTLGESGYVAAPGDFDGDRKTDQAVYQASTGTWIVLLSSDGSRRTYSNLLGGPGWIPVVGDYDADGLADPAVHKNSTGEWKILLSKSHYSQLSAPIDF